MTAAEVRSGATLIFALTLCAAPAAAANAETIGSHAVTVPLDITQPTDPPPPESTTLPNCPAPDGGACFVVVPVPPEPILPPADLTMVPIPPPIPPNVTPLTPAPNPATGPSNPAANSSVDSASASQTVTEAETTIAPAPSEPVAPPSPSVDPYAGERGRQLESAEPPAAGSEEPVQSASRSEREGVVIWIALSAAMALAAAATGIALARRRTRRAANTAPLD